MNTGTPTSNAATKTKSRTVIGLPLSRRQFAA
jgi:hypothetical protein